MWPLVVHMRTAPRRAAHATFGSTLEFSLSTIKMISKKGYFRYRFVVVFFCVYEFEFSQDKIPQRLKQNCSFNRQSLKWQK